MNIPQWTRQIPNEKLNLLVQYVKLMLKFNKKINLISRSSKKQSSEQLCWELILESYLASTLLMKDKKLKKQKEKTFLLADLGSGAGFPGLVTGIFYPKDKIWLVESSQKKSYFLRLCTYSLKLSNVEVKNRRVQDLDQSFSFAVSKAFFSLAYRLTLTRHLFKKGAIYYHLSKPGLWEKEHLDIPEEEKNKWTKTLLFFPKNLSNKSLIRLEKIKN